MDDFFGKNDILSRLFASTLEGLLEAELTEHLGYERYGRRPQPEALSGRQEEPAGKADEEAHADGEEENRQYGSGKKKGNSRNGK